MEQLNYRHLALSRAKGSRLQAVVGVVASGDLEVLVERTLPDGECEVDIRTPITGFGDVWSAVVADFVDFAGAEFGIHQHGPGVHGGEGEEDGDESAAIFDDDHDAVAGPNAEIVAEPGFGFLDHGI